MRWDDSEIMLSNNNILKSHYQIILSNYSVIILHKQVLSDNSGFGGWNL